MRLHSYVVARDFGFAPNPFYGTCTLATCKPVIRRVAQVGDVVVGTGSRSYGLEGRLVFAMVVSETLSYDEYWSDVRFLEKRPSLLGSKKQSFGDNIYHRARGKWVQANSHHSLASGKANPLNVAHDTQSPRVLVAERFVYWGGEGPRIPSRFRDPEDICGHRGHRSNFSDRLLQRFIRWLDLDTRGGYRGDPAEWLS